MTIELNGYYTLILATLVLLLGRFLVVKVKLICWPPGWKAKSAAMAVWTPPALPTAFRQPKTSALMRKSTN